MANSSEISKTELVEYINFSSKSVQQNCHQKEPLYNCLTVDIDIEKMNMDDAYHLFVKDEAVDIPFAVWLLENPDSPISFPGSIYLNSHDYIHLMLNRGMSLFDEAFVVGYTMGNCDAINNHYIQLYKLASTCLYPKKYKFRSKHMLAFDIGFMYGQKIPTKNIHLFNFCEFKSKSIKEVRSYLGISIFEVRHLWKAEQVLVSSSD
ncbi:hypothetical protein [Acaryochloris sp. IP29b_bin.148]|uniref:hypothetical protein n=1 Tax=Acaryochloris sp. IP29b_bin.148 TaxID=2969218 RepID=UPI002601CA2D|nr:hypothetical protein [Acaryochloris sp. IP29b_bin.148]